MLGMHWLAGSRQTRVHWRNHGAWGGKVTRPRRHTMVSHMRRIHHKLRRGVLVVMLCHDCMLMRRAADARGRGAWVVDRSLVLMLLMWMMMLLLLLLLLGLGRRVIGVLLLGLLAWERGLGRVVDMIVPDSVVSRQRGFETWVPPERTALDGCRRLGGRNLMGDPLGRRCWRRLAVLE